MKKISFVFVLLAFISITCYGEINFDYQFSVPVDQENNSYYNVWLADGNGDDQDELYVFIGDIHNSESQLLTEYDLNGDLLSENNEPISENVWWFYGGMYESDDSIYFIEVDARATEPYMYCDVKVFDYITMTLIDSSAIEIGSASMSGDYPYVNFMNVVERNGSQYLYLGISVDSNFGCDMNSVDPFIYKYSFDQGTLGLPEEILGVGTDWQYPAGAESIMSIGYSDYFSWFTPDSNYRRCNLNNITFDTPAIVNDIMQVENDYSSSLYMQFQNNYDDHYLDYGPVVWESLNNMLHCYTPDFSEVLWVTAVPPPSLINMGPSTCISTNEGDNYIMYFFNDNYLEIRNRITGYCALREDAQIVPFKILQKSDGELLFLTESDSLISVYTLAEEIQLDNDDNEIKASQYNLSNYPNPFNPETVISFSLPEDGDVELEIYNTKGQRIRELKIGNAKCKNNSVVWNGEDDKGNISSSGIYFYRLRINGISKASGKCLLIK